MTTSWVKCCFERGRLRHRSRKGTKQLDERYGDMDISGPMDGGWNQVPMYLSEKRSSSLPRSRNGSKHEKDNNDTMLYFKAHNGTQPFVCVKEGYPEPTSSSSNDKPPDFVYKPASEAFFKDMAEIGRPKYPSPPLPSSSSSSSPLDKHRRHISTQSTSSLEPTLPGEIPCHPSYNRNMGLGRRTPSPQLGSSTGALHYHHQRSPPPPPLTSSPYSRCVSPALSHRSRFDEEPREEELLEKQMTKQLLLSNMKTKPKKTRRVVTEELVPSTTELFG